MGALAEHGGEVTRDSEVLKPAAVKYWYSILQPQHPTMGPRNARESRTLCRALDLLTEKRYGEAADLIAQRLKALERALVDGHWDRAVWCELLSPEGTTLLDRDEDRMVAAEQLLQARLRPRQAWQPHYQSNYQHKDQNGHQASDPTDGKGKGKDKGKKAKGQDGKGKNGKRQ